MYNDADVHEAKAIGAAMKRYDVQHTRNVGTFTKG